MPFINRPRAEEQTPARVRVGGLWRNTTPDGKPYLSGSLGGGLTIRVYPNDFKQSEADPDFNLYFQQVNQKKSGGAAAPDPTADPFS